jgi:hypothetical protein
LAWLPREAEKRCGLRQIGFITSRDRQREPEVSGMNANDPMSAETWDYIRFGAMGVGVVLAFVAVALLGYRVDNRRASRAT